METKGQEVYEVDGRWEMRHKRTRRRKEKGIGWRGDMMISEEAQKITDILYKAYGTHTGILFGISSPEIVGVIVQFTLEHSGNKEEGKENE